MTAKQRPPENWHGLGEPDCLIETQRSDVVYGRDMRGHLQPMALNTPSKELACKEIEAYFFIDN